MDICGIMTLYCVGKRNRWGQFCTFPFGKRRLLNLYLICKALKIGNCRLYYYRDRMNLEGLCRVPHGVIVEKDKNRLHFARDAATYIFLPSSL